MCDNSALSSALYGLIGNGTETRAMKHLTEDLVAEAVEGDAAAVRTIVRGLQRPFYNLALRMLMVPADAEEAAQEALLRVVTRLSTFDGRSKFSTWAWRVAVRRILDFREGVVRAPMLTFEDFAADLSHGLDRDASDPDDAPLLQQVKVACGRALLQCLDGDHRVAYVLGEVLELTGTEAADVLGIPAATFRKRLSRARERVSEHLTRHCGVVSSDAVCSCSGRSRRARELQRLAPGDREGQLDLVTLRRTIQEVSELARGGIYYRADPSAQPPPGLLARVEAAVVAQR